MTAVASQPIATLFFFSILAANSGSDCANASPPLQEHGIGQDHALFYEAYAAFLELKGNYAAGAAVYQAGIDR